jgi:hypothetical protein
MFGMGSMEMMISLVFIAMGVAFWGGLIWVIARFVLGPTNAKLDRLISLIEAQNRSSGR